MQNLSRTIVSVAIAVGLALAPTVAEAAPGRALTAVNVRSGPGLGYGIVARLSADEYVVVVQCSLYWCEVKRTGKNGWVSRKYLYNPYYSSGPGKGYEFPPKGPEPGRISGR